MCQRTAAMREIATMPGSNGTFEADERSWSSVTLNGMPSSSSVGWTRIWSNAWGGLLKNAIGVGGERSSGGTGTSGWLGIATPRLLGTIRPLGS